MLNVQFFYCILEVMKKVGSFLTLDYHIFLWIGITFAFFHLYRNYLFSMEDSKIVSKGFEIDSPQILSIRIHIILWPWGLLRSRSWIGLWVSSLQNQSPIFMNTFFIEHLRWLFISLLNNTDVITFSFSFKYVEGSLLESFIKEHSPAKNELEIPVFSLI